MTNFFSTKIIPMLLSLLILLMLFHAFTMNIMSLAVPALFIVGITFALCDYAKWNKWQGSFIYIAVALLLLFFSYMYISRNGAELDVVYWLIGDPSGTEHTDYFMILFFCSCFFVSSIIYYFTYIIFRPHFILLIVVLPCVLHIKKGVTLSPFFVIVMILVYLLHMVFVEHVVSNHASTVPSSSWLTPKILPFFIITTALAIGTTFLPTFEIFETTKLIKGNDIRGLMEYASSSGIPGEGEDLKQVLFEVEADEQLYFIRQVFGKYDGAQWNAIMDSKLLNGYTNWDVYTEKLNLNDLFDDIKMANALPNANDILRRFNTVDPQLRSIEENKIAKVTTQKYPSYYILAPSRTFKVTDLPQGIQCSRSPMDEIFVLDSKNIPPNQRYSVSYYSESIGSVNFVQYINQFTMSDFEILLNKLNGVTQKMDQPYHNIAQYFLDNYNSAVYYQKYAGTYDSPRLKALAEEITKDCTSDFEKAVAIQQYFHTTGYVYSTSYHPPKGSEDIEYFVFDSKTGSCSHYATAMTLMSRMVGLNARYVEGFTSTEKNMNNKYVIRAKNAHAFTQVYLPVYGWKTFDATVPSYFEEQTPTAGIQIPQGFKDQLTPFFLSLTITILICAFLFLIYVYFLAEYFFRLKVTQSENNRAFVLIYERVSKLLSKQLGEANRTSQQIALDANTALHFKELEIITLPYERMLFNNENLTNEDKARALTCYRLFYIHCKKRKST